MSNGEYGGCIPTELRDDLEAFFEDGVTEHAACDHKFSDGVSACIQEVESWFANRPQSSIHITVEGVVSSDEIAREFKCLVFAA